MDAVFRGFADPSHHPGRLMGALVRSLPRPRLPRKLPSIGSLPSLPPWKIVRRWLIVALLLAIALIAGYMLWFRTSSFVAVEDIKITGTEQLPEVESALRAAAEQQSTVHPDAEALQAAVAGNPLVANLAIDTDFPHTMLLDVEVRTPVAYLEDEGVVVAGDGVVLDRSGNAPEGVPSIQLDKEIKGGDIGNGSGPTAGLEVLSGEQLEVARVLGAAPGPLFDEVNGAAYTKDLGITVDLGPGLELRFGDAGAAPLKWKAAAAVLADPKFEGATYLDLAVPDRPVAGGVSESDVSVDPAVTDAAATAVDPAADPTATTAVDPATTAVDPAVTPVTDPAVTPVDPAATTVP